MRKKKMALLLLFGIVISMVSGVVSAIVTIKVERSFTVASESSQGDEDDTKPVLQRAALYIVKRAPRLER